MPKMIPKQHRIGNLASKKIHAILAECNILSEDITNDYGEDIILQANLEDVADSFHVFVQVKGISYLQKSRSSPHYSIRLYVSDLQRWVSMNSAFLLCIYDASCDRIYGLKIKTMFSLWQLSTTKNKSFKVKFNDSNTVDKETIEGFIWECRAEYYSRMLAWYDNNVFYSDIIEDRNFAMNARRERSLVVFSFLNSIRFLRSDDFDKSTLDKIANCCKKFAEINKTDQDTPKLSIKGALMLVLFAQAADVGLKGVQINLAEAGTDLLEMFLKSRHRDFYQECERILSSDA